MVTYMWLSDKCLYIEMVVYYIDSLQEAVKAPGDNKGDDSEQIYISIPEDKWDEFAKGFFCPGVQ